MKSGRIAARRLALSSLRVRLVLLVLLAVLPSLILILHRASEQRRAAITQVKQDALRVARLASANQEQFAEGARQLLIALTHLPELQGQDPAAANAALQSLLPRYSLYSNLGVIESNGSLFGSALGVPPNTNLADRSYFQSAMANGDFAVGDYQIGRITGRPSMNFAYPLFDKVGRVRRVVFAAMDLSWLERLAGSAELRPFTALTVMDANGVVLAGWPDPEKKRGRMVLNEGLQRLINVRYEGIVELPGPDGAPRIVALAPLQEAGSGGHVTVAVSVPKEKVMQESTELLMRNLGWLAVVAGLAVAAAWYGGDSFILAPVRAMLKVTRRVHDGDLAARTGVSHEAGELGQLAEAFDEMTASLQRRGTERDRAQEELQKLNCELEARVEERTSELHQKNEQLRADLELAREFQVGLLPHRSPILLQTSGDAPRTLRLTHRFEPSGDVGGDFFEVLPLSETEVGIFVSDVMGHGVKAALLAALIRGLVEQLKPVAHDPARFIHEVNEALVGILRTTGDTMFASAVYVIIDARNNVMRYACAGHSRPLHLHRRTGKVEPLQFAGGLAGPVLGLFSSAVYGAGTANIEQGDGLLIYTDGVFEVSDPHDEEFGEKRLREAIQRRVSLPLDKIFTEVVDEIQEFSASRTFEDDVCMVGVEVDLK